MHQESTTTATALALACSRSLGSLARLAACGCNCRTHESAARVNSGNWVSTGRAAEEVSVAEISWWRRRAGADCGSKSGLLPSALEMLAVRAEDLLIIWYMGH
eukprot:6198058-Pleurochrysis_carterae.AAC.5